MTASTQFAGLVIGSKAWNSGQEDEATHLQGAAADALYVDILEPLSRLVNTKPKIVSPGPTLSGSRNLRRRASISALVASVDHPWTARPPPWVKSSRDR